MPGPGRFVVALTLLVGLATAQDRRQAGDDTPVRSSTSIADPIHVPGSLNELVRLSPVIVVATSRAVLPSRLLVPDDARSDIVTESVLRIDQSWKGEIPVAAEILVRQLGGEFQGARQSVQNVKPIEPGRRYVLFLQPIPEIRNDRFDRRRFWTTGIWAGLFEVIDGRVRVSGAAQPGLRALDGLAESEIAARVTRP